MMQFSQLRDALRNSHIQGALLIVATGLIFYIFTFWMVRRMSKLAKIKYFLVRGLIGSNEYIDKIKRPLLVGFFHPYCNAGGGGERVLWTAVKALQMKYSTDQVRIFIYTGDIEVPPETILENARSKFGISLLYDVDFIYLKGRRWLEAKNYPHATLLLQSLGSILVALEALSQAIPDILVDSMGYAAIYPFFKYMGCCKIVAYVHYPTISSDMLDAVESGMMSVNNSALFTRNHLMKSLKLYYYTYFAELYGFVGRCSDATIANSTWTKNHLLDVWSTDKISVVYPPCDVSSFTRFPISGKRKDYIISIGQFRPEKDHSLQIKSFAKFIQNGSYIGKRDVKLILIGGCRNAEDEGRIEILKELASQLGVTANIEFHVNCSYEVLKDYLSVSKVGIHTMWNEHFGIGVVEYQAAGCICLAHNSGGPKLDIVVPFNGNVTGFLADDELTYSAHLDAIFNMTEDERARIAHSARQRAQEFSEENFELGFMEHMVKFMEALDEKKDKAK